MDKIFEDVKTKKLNLKNIKSFIGWFDTEFEYYCQ